MRFSTSLAGVGAAALVAAVLSTTTASAAPTPTPFDPAKPTIFVAQNSPTQLNTAAADTSGAYSFTAVGPATLTYNALSWDPADNFLYGFTSDGARTGIPNGSLIKIGANGAIERVGTSTWNPTGVGGSSPGFNVGAIGSNGDIYATQTVDNKMYVIDPATGTQVGSAITLSQSINGPGGAWEVSDWTFSQGYLWGLGSGKTIIRVDPATGTVSNWTLSATVDTGFSGASWTYLDGTVGFSHNVSGEIDRIQIADPSSATPTFTLVKKSSGPATSNNDGAAIPGLPADLGITKTSAGYVPGKTVTYTLTVTNHGKGWSTGWTVADAVPAALTNVKATSSGSTCAVMGNDVSCVGGLTAPGASTFITVTADVPSTLSSKVTNTATVTGNDPDPNPGNNSASVSNKAAPALSIVKTATPTTVSQVGDVVHYTFVVKNTGNVDLSNVKVTDTQEAPAGALTSGPTCPATTLAIGASMDCTGTYTATAADVAHGSIKDSAVATADGASAGAAAGVHATSAPSVVTVAVVPAGPSVPAGGTGSTSSSDDALTWGLGGLGGALIAAAGATEVIRRRR